MSHGGLKRARSWKRRIQPKEAYSSPGLLSERCPSGPQRYSAHPFRHADDTTPHFDREQEPPSQWNETSRGRDYEGDCRSWRIAICSSDAVGDNSDAFLIERYYRSELSTPNLSS